jgi:putative DNA primase/helicase
VRSLAQAEVDARSEPVIEHVRAIDAETFLGMRFEAREAIMSPIMHRQSLGMIYAKRGIGKTMLALDIAVAIATGTNFLRYRVSSHWKVLYIDGEMPAVLLQERLASALKRLPDGAVWPSADYLRIVTPDVQERPLPDLSVKRGQALIDAQVDDVDVVVIDNLSTLCRTGVENEADSWGEIQAWLLDLRRRGKTVLLEHHAGKHGEQRGTSKREDVLDFVLKLKRPTNYRASQGARFELHLEKARSVHGDDAEPFEAWLQGDVWTFRNVADAPVDPKAAEMKRLHAGGRTLREIAIATGCSAATVSRRLKES